MRVGSTIVVVWLLCAGTAQAEVADPVAADVAVFQRLLTAGGGTAAEIAAFQAAHPDWPRADLLERRRQEAVVAGGPVAGDCVGATAAALLLACLPVVADPAPMFARLYAAGLAGEALIKRYGATLPPGVAYARFAALMPRDPGRAASVLPLLADADRPASEAWLALVRRDPRTEAAFARLTPAALVAHAEVFGARLAALRATDPAAAALLCGYDGAPWRACERVVREAMRTDIKAARALAGSLRADGEEQAAARDFLVGWLALRDGAPADAATAFARLAAGRAALTRSRGLYWQGRAAQALGDDPGPLWREAAGRWPLTFYGQCAARALGLDPAAGILAARDPVPGDVPGVLAGELPRAALVAWGAGDLTLARGFLLRAAEPPLTPYVSREREGGPSDPTPPHPLAGEGWGEGFGDRTVIAALAHAMGLEDVAVTIARRMGRDGAVLPGLGWPAVGGAAPLTLAIMRQESGFDPLARSPVGAIGLMQVMPATAAAVAQQAGLPDTPEDPGVNRALGEAYLATLWAKYGSVPLVAAAYNAGPQRADQWLASGDPRGASGSGYTAMIDWIETIPFNETRNYVQRVMENLAVYEARAR